MAGFVYQTLNRGSPKAVPCESDLVGDTDSTVSIVINEAVFKDWVAVRQHASRLLKPLEELMV